MALNSLEFWHPENQSKPATSFALAAVELRIGNKLPTSFTELMNVHNGGKSRFPNYAVDENEIMNVFIDGNLCEAEEIETLSSISKEIEFSATDIPWKTLTDKLDKLVVVSRHGWTWFVCLDYRGIDPNNKNLDLDPGLCIMEASADPRFVLEVGSWNFFLTQLKK